jgi:excisionase family DNA binding protein
MSQDWVQHAVRKLGLPAYRIGSQLRFRPSEVDTWIETQRASEVSS